MGLWSWLWRRRGDTVGRRARSGSPYREPAPIPRPIEPKPIVAATARSCSRGTPTVSRAPGAFVFLAMGASLVVALGRPRGASRPPRLPYDSKAFQLPTLDLTKGLSTAAFAVDAIEIGRPLGAPTLGSATARALAPKARVAAPRGAASAAPSASMVRAPKR